MKVHNIDFVHSSYMSIHRPEMTQKGVGLLELS